MPLIRAISVSGSIPTVNQLALGDLAINTFDGKAYIKKYADNTQTIIELGSGGASVSASYALSSSYSDFALTASYALNAQDPFPYTGSALITGSLGLTGSLSTDDTVFLKGLIGQDTSQNHVVTFNNTTGQLFITASSAFGGGGGGGSPGGTDQTIQYNDAGAFNGSTDFKFNAALPGVILTGSLSVSGSVEIDGQVTAAGFTGSLFGTSSWAENALNANTASYVETAQTASYVLQAVSASFASTASFVETAQTASYVTLAQTASYVETAQTASYVLQAVSSSYAVTASYAENALSASYAPDTTFPYTGSALITGSLGVTGSVSLYDSGSTIFNVEGSTGQLFSITDSLTGSLFSVNTVAGLPIIEAFSDNTVNIGKFGVYPIKVTNSGNTATITGSLFGTASYADQALSASYTETASYINPLDQIVEITGSTNISGAVDIVGSLTAQGDSIDLQGSTNIILNSATIQAPLLPTSIPPGATPLNTVLVDVNNGTLYVTSSLPGTGGGGGGLADRILTGSITASVDVGTDPTNPNFFLIESASIEMFKFNTDRVMVLESRNPAPTAVTGGVFYSESGDFYFGTL